VDPTVTVPKSAGDGLTGNGGTGTETPVPVSDSAAGEPGALLVMETVPEEATAVVGLKLTVKLLV